MGQLSLCTVGSPLQGFQSDYGALPAATHVSPLLQGFHADEGALRGVALLEAEDRLRYFPADALPAAPAARFAALFAARPPLGGRRHLALPGRHAGGNA